MSFCSGALAANGCGSKDSSATQTWPNSFFAEVRVSMMCWSETFLRADLHGTSFAYDCRMRLLKQALLASGKDRIQLIILIVVTTVVRF